MTLYNIFRFFFKRGKNNLIKVLSLGVGLAMGLVLIAKVYFEQSYDDFVPDADRIYLIQSNFFQQGSEMKTWTQVSGAIAPGMKKDIPKVELATRYTFLVDNATFYDTADKQKYQGTCIMADSCLFDMFPRRILAGNPHEVLSRPLSVMVSQQIAEKMGGVSTVVGKVIEPDAMPGLTWTIGGVFENIPENSHLKFDIVVSMPSIKTMFGYDGSMNWVGNDRYRGYVKLLSGVSPESLAPSIRRMQEHNQPLDQLKEAGVDLQYTLLPLRDVHSGTPEAKSMVRLLSLLAFAILFTAMMNYILIVISSLVHRSKEMAVNKCYGASSVNIYGRMFSETFVHLLISLVLALLFILAFREMIVDLLDTSLVALFSLKGCLVLSVVCLFVFVISGCIPGYLFARIPVSSAFRNYNETRRFWKLGLLFVQFMAAGFLVTLVVIIARQYDYMVKDSPGYAYENLAYVELSGVNAESRGKIVEEVGRISEVASVTTCTELLLNHASGNNISLPGDTRDLFNIADLYTVGNGYLDLMEIPIVEGRSFMENIVSSNEVMVSRSFVEKMKQFTDWSDGAVGKNILISEHSQEGMPPFTICGVYEDFRNGAIGNEDSRPTIMFYSSTPGRILMVKHHKQTAESNKLLLSHLEQLLPNKEVIVHSYPFVLVSMYDDFRKFRNAVLIGSIVALLISLIGLVGYTNDEMNRRRKETAIRKINGATISDVLSLFMKDILRVALPAVVLAAGIAFYIAFSFQDRFSEKMPLSPFLFIICGLFVLVVIQSIVTLNCYQAATENPANSVKTE